MPAKDWKRKRQWPECTSFRHSCARRNPVRPVSVIPAHAGIQSVMGRELSRIVSQSSGFQDRPQLKGIPDLDLSLGGEGAVPRGQAKGRLAGRTERARGQAAGPSQGQAPTPALSLGERG